MKPKQLFKICKALILSALLVMILLAIYSAVIAAVLNAAFPKRSTRDLVLAILVSPWFSFFFVKFLHSNEDEFWAFEAECREQPYRGFGKDAINLCKTKLLTFAVMAVPPVLNLIFRILDVHVLHKSQFLTKITFVFMGTFIWEACLDLYFGVIISVLLNSLLYVLYYALLRRKWDKMLKNSKNRNNNGDGDAHVTPFQIRTRFYK